MLNCTLIGDVIMYTNHCMRRSCLLRKEMGRIVWSALGGVYHKRDQLHSINDPQGYRTVSKYLA